MSPQEEAMNEAGDFFGNGNFFFSDGQLGCPRKLVNG